MVPFPRDTVMKWIKWLLALVLGGGGATAFYTAEPELANRLLGDAVENDINKYVIIVGAIWWAMKGKVGEAFDRMKKEFRGEIHEGFVAVTKSIDSFRDVVKQQGERLDMGDRVLKDHEERLTKLEQRS